MQSTKPPPSQELSGASTEDLGQPLYLGEWTDDEPPLGYTTMNISYRQRRITRYTELASGGSVLFGLAILFGHATPGVMLGYLGVLVAGVGVASYIDSWQSGMMWAVGWTLATPPVVEVGHMGTYLVMYVVLIPIAGALWALETSRRGHDVHHTVALGLGLLTTTGVFVL